MGYVEELRELVGHRPLIFVGAVVVLEDADGHILLQRRRFPEGTWGLPGGLMELAESIEDTARREVLEETGLRLGKLQLLGVFSQPELIRVPNGDQFYVVLIGYRTSEYEGTLTNDETESFECGFYPIDRLPEPVVRSHGRVLDRYLAGN